MNDVPSDLQKRIAKHGQEHALKFWDELTNEERQHLSKQLESIDFALIDSFQQDDSKSVVGDVQPAEVFTLDETYCELGVKRIANGELGVLTVAGGQGTRLGWNGPKGTFPATPITGKSLFQVVAEQIVFASNKYKVSIPWYIMTSTDNDAVTKSFLLDNNCFGIDRTDIFIFTQGEVPVIDANGKMLLSSKGSIAMNPDGHGGVVAALKNSGGLEEMEARGIQYLSYVQIDNPLANVVDPSFLGIHLCNESSKEASSKCVRKTKPDERVGVFCNVGGKTTVVEYSDLDSEKAKELNPQGELQYNAGSIAIHMLSTKFLQRIADELPWHIAHKIVPYIDLQTGEPIEPAEPNAYKFERFVFDVLPLASNSLVVATKREDEFAPIKNASGSDSVQTSHQLQKERAASWLRSNGVQVSSAASVEISPLTAASAVDLAQVELPDSIDDNEVVAM